MTRGPAGLEFPIAYGSRSSTATALIAGLPADEPVPTSPEIYSAKRPAAGEVAAFEVGERFYEIGSPAGLAEADTHLSRTAGEVP